ncbi:MAG: EAL domain-containing protein [Gammaproteobacteria bacterium]|nr:EAL domain-containing protein [Gammaproteobacteria bacterium]
MPAPHTRRPLQPSIVAAGVFLLAAALSGLIVWQLEQHRLEHKRASIANLTSDHVHTIEHTIEHALSAAHALAALVRQSNGSVHDFDATARKILPFYPGASELALAPGGVVRNIAPLPGNEIAIGLDLLNTPTLRKESLLARDSGKLTLAGPLKLVMGGMGVVGRLPVFLDDSEGRPFFWGFTIVVMRLPEGLDTEHLSHLREQGLAYELWRIQPDTRQKQIIARSAPTAAPLIEPVEQTLHVPNVSWTLSVAPIDGWGHMLEPALQAALGFLFSLTLGYLAKLFVAFRMHKQVLEASIAQRTAEMLVVQRKLEATLDAIPDLVWLKDANGVYLSCNPMFERLYGASEADIVGKTDYDFVDRELADFFREHDRIAMTAGKPSLNEEWLTFADDGSQGLFETIKTPMVNDGGKVIGVLGIARDITARTQAERALLESQQRTLQYLNIAGVMLVALDSEGRVQLVNRKGCEMLGAAEADILGQDWFENFLPECIREDIREAFSQLIKGNIAPVEYLENAILTRGGEERIVAWHNAILRDESGRINGVLSSGEDITERKRAEAQVSLAAKVFEQSGEGILITDAQRNIIMVNQAFTAISGYSEAEVLGRNPRLLSSGRHDSTFYKAMWEAISTQGHWQGEVWNRRKDGSLYPELLSIMRVLDTNGEITHYIGISNDITQRKAAQEHIQRLAHFDPLTGLPNRVLLNDRICHDLRTAQRSRTQLTVMFVDLDHFKNVNDSLGHRIGDELLVAVALRLKTAVREVDTVSRQGGDEFILILPNTDADGAAHVAEKLLTTIAQSYQIENYELTVTLSIGIALYPGDGTDFEVLSKCADAAMYRAKHDGRNNYRFFTAEMQARSTHNLKMENALRRALERDQLQLHYQPQIALHDGSIVGVEALLRWRHPELGMVAPAVFIPIAEESGQILQIGEWALRSAVRQMKTWLDGGLAPMTMAVNLSAVQFRHPHLPELVTQILEEVTLAPHYLELELTEGVAMEDAPAAIAVMDRLHERGIRMSIDDFGTGYSSLSYLKRFKVHRLKIDQSFVREIGADAEDRAIVVAIIGLANSLGLKTIAEGVETAEQLAFLREQGCNEVQGYYFSKPLPAEQFEAFVRAGPPSITR